MESLAEKPPHPAAFGVRPLPPGERAIQYEWLLQSPPPREWIGYRSPQPSLHGEPCGKAPSPGRLRRPPSPARGEGDLRHRRVNALHPHGSALSPRGRGRRGAAEPGEGTFSQGSPWRDGWMHPPRTSAKVPRGWKARTFLGPRNCWIAACAGMAAVPGEFIHPQRTRYRIWRPAMLSRGCRPLSSRPRRSLSHPMSL
jgi:hypothetical protein